mmetsp:Transcript_17221/g.48441  ORF Transcript_17221/g.48441 Transcript_17221/m.48441 type:complete len:269 (-) Transcript_17221:730-1536(-)
MCVSFTYVCMNMNEVPTNMPLRHHILNGRARVLLPQRLARLLHGLLEVDGLPLPAVRYQEPSTVIDNGLDDGLAHQDAVLFLHLLVERFVVIHDLPVNDVSLMPVDRPASTAQHILRFRRGDEARLIFLCALTVFLAPRCVRNAATRHRLRNRDESRPCGALLAHLAIHCQKLLLLGHRSLAGTGIAIMRCADAVDVRLRQLFQFGIAAISRVLRLQQGSCEQDALGGFHLPFHDALRKGGIQWSFCTCHGFCGCRHFLMLVLMLVMV